METRYKGRGLFKQKMVLARSIVELSMEKRVGYCFLKGLKIDVRSPRGSSKIHGFCLSDDSDSLVARSGPRYKLVAVPFAEGRFENYDSDTWERIAAAEKGDTVNVILRRIGSSYQLIDMVKSE